MCSLDVLIFIFIVISVCVVCTLCSHSKPQISGGFHKHIDGVKNVLLVDVANMYTGWYMEKYKKETRHVPQPELIREYLECMHDHFAHFSKHNNLETDSVNYIIKNYKYSLNKKEMYAPHISPDSWTDIYNFVKNHNAYVTVAEDYKNIPYTAWKSPKSHYLRGCDDYLCFKMAQQYKKKYIHPVIMSDDKFKDYDQFGFVPEFKATYIYADLKADSSNPIIITPEIVKPKPNTLGQIVDYDMVKITMDFDFKDPKFLKTSTYKIAEPGHVWD